MDDEANVYARIREGVAMMNAEHPINTPAYRHMRPSYHTERSWREHVLMQIVEIVIKIDAMAKKQDAMIEKVNKFEWMIVEPTNYIIKMLHDMEDRARDAASLASEPLHISSGDDQQDAGDAMSDGDNAAFVAMARQAAINGPDPSNLMSAGVDMIFGRDDAKR